MKYRGRALCRTQDMRYCILCVYFEYTHEYTRNIRVRIHEVSHWYIEPNFALRIIRVSSNVLKQRAYEQRIREIEHASFTPIVLSTTGGMGPIATTFYKRLADRLASKWNSSYSQTIGWLRCRLSFSLLRSSILCIRGARSAKGRVPCSVPLPVDLVHCESRFTLD